MARLKTGGQQKKELRGPLGLCCHCGCASHGDHPECLAAGEVRGGWRGLAEYDAMAGIAWLWEAAAGSNIEALPAQESTGPNPADRGKNGTKRSLLVASGANRHIAFPQVGAAI